MTGPPLWVAELAELFWQQTNGPEAFPRRLRDPILWCSFDLSIEELPDLTVHRVRERLRQRNCPSLVNSEDRPLRGCLVASAGGGMIFLDADDPPDEQTFTLAHELAHFLRDHYQVRDHAVARLGPGVLSVLEGVRPPSPSERLHALLNHIPLRSTVHLLSREEEYVCPSVARSEWEADRLALELLAPAHEVEQRLGEAANPTAVREALTRTFGLSGALAAVYAELLFPLPAPCPLMARLKKSQSACRTSLPARESDSGGSRDEQDR